MKVSKQSLFDSIGIGLFTLIYSIVMSGFSLWMGASAFIAVAYFFGVGFPKDQVWNIIASFTTGIVWGLIAFSLLQMPGMDQTLPTAIILGIMTFLAIILQGSIMKFTIVPAWFVSWGTFMLIVSNVKFDSMPIFMLQLFATMLLGIFLIGYGSDALNKVLYRFFPEEGTEPEVKIEELDELGEIED
ncbi:hypothetical protein LOSG293_080170 [Secundilactobacillus oryzae JCM 18671]|uniref:DUF1097 domain-containing protein n=1 Tax=Secundilactobacillus oryzae JCM 18671 TaxID=1291743 RepID=A0A081BHL3_9LACO|nr:DUF1097 domain-containing protein [Secundilactobacillus oryzae]GAK47531.1 hypothetical protein LOSG293_080170 [Secundilactobacillus oryzae JCM 18671]